MTVLAHSCAKQNKNVDSALRQLPVIAPACVPEYVQMRMEGPVAWARMLSSVAHKVVEDCADRAAHALLEELDAEEEAAVSKKSKKKNKKKQQNKKKQEKEAAAKPVEAPPRHKHPAQTSPPDESSSSSVSDRSDAEEKTWSKTVERQDEPPQATMQPTAHGGESGSKR